MNPVPFKLEKTDIRGITRMSDRMLTTVELGHRQEKRIEWLILGQCQVNYNEPTKTWALEARMTSGVTDFEHDSAYALRLPLIGLTFEAVYYHQTKLNAWVDPEFDRHEGDNFRVPLPGYNPMEHPRATKCKDSHCESKGHVIIPEGFWLPPFNKALFDAVRGRQVTISIGPVFKDE